MFHLQPNTIAAIKKSLHAGFKGQTTFPEHVKTIADVGVTRYIVDMLQSKVIYHFADNDIHTETLPATYKQYNFSFFDPSAVKNAIKEIQQQAIDYPTFLERIASAGTKSYEVNITKGRIIYQGENDRCIEEFPKLT